MPQEAASRIAVFRRERAVRRSQDRVRRAEEPEHLSCGLNLHLDASATMCLVNRGGLGKAKHVDMQNLWIQEASTARRFVTKKVGTNVNPADLMTKPLANPKVEQLMSIMGCEFWEIDVDSLEGRSTGV